ncbi:MAG: aminotransferase class V-fold PLP-dependent enzyme [Rhodospirillaceae bacterium]|jgi:cysteine desulfurase|nr:aminotransferase class V-fold PLP-dependent enzyme [Rhodospirillaceae bacterium]MBT4939411.1 aminotransferase class V-fold PLP-dependent enzyme [Rhodospirillaceae bacterium]MBT5940562.1 aminotransferase class V-fold PLP-dependent enzyme [Rhodospirillaceae bacterium]
MSLEKRKGRPVYLDNHATTPLDERVVEAMMPFFGEKFGNPHSGSHFYGWEAAEAVEVARGQIADAIGADASEIYFTSGATEANNLAIKGVARFYREKKNHIITCVSEHMCVLDTCFQMEKEGNRVTYLKVDQNGLFDLDELQKAICEDTILISIMTVQNEIGLIQPMAEIGAMAAEHKVLLHSDAAQALGKIPLDVKAMNINLMSITGHKVYGPMGLGALYVSNKPRVRLEPVFNGGGQEKNLRSGTLPPPLCVGFGKTCELAVTEMPTEAKSLEKMRDDLLERLTTKLDGIHINGSMENRVSGNLNISIEDVDAESLMAALPDLAMSSGSACTSASEESSYVLKAIGLSNEMAEASLRIGLGRFNTEDEVDYAAERLIDEITNVREGRKSLSGNAAE